MLQAPAVMPYGLTAAYCVAPMFYCKKHTSQCVRVDYAAVCSYVKPQALFAQNSSQTSNIFMLFSYGRYIIFGWIIVLIMYCKVT